MLAIYKKELKSYFNSAFGYVFVALFLVIVGIFFFANNLFSSSPNFEYTLSSILFVFFILVPLLTMRLLAEERHQKTDQLLLTSPVSVEKIVIGKYLAISTVYLLAMIVICFYPLILKRFGEVDLVSAYAGILGFTLMGLAFLGLGLFISACTENQIVAGVISFVVILLFVYMAAIVSLLPSDNRSALIILSVLLVAIGFLSYYMMNNIVISAAIVIIGEACFLLLYRFRPSFFDRIIARVFGWLSVTERFDNFMNGTIDMASVIYLVSFAFIFVFLAIQSMKKRRWR